MGPQFSGPVRPKRPSSPEDRPRLRRRGDGCHSRDMTTAAFCGKTNTDEHALSPAKHMMLTWTLTLAEFLLNAMAPWSLPTLLSDMLPTVTNALSTGGESRPSE